jgi:hypothetical protein
MQKYTNTGDKDKCQIIYNQVFYRNKMIPGKIVIGYYKN